MANLGRELSSINFEAMLGGPLTAVVNAQAQAAMTTVDFIKQVGFHPDEDDALDAPKTAKPIYVTFKYPKEVSPYQPKVTEEQGGKTVTVTEAKAAVTQEMELTVPILTMLPIPFLRVEETTIDFNAKINSIETHRNETDYKRTTDWQGRIGWWITSSSLKVSTAYQSKTRSGIETKRTYSMVVRIRAVQDEMPAGTERLLGILENAIASKPIGEPTSG